LEAAEKIPKKLYVYLDTTRGHHHRHGGKDVRHRGAGDRVRHARERRVRRGADVAGIKKPCGALRLRCCRKTPQGVPTEKARRLASLNKTV